MSPGGCPPHAQPSFNVCICNLGYTLEKGKACLFHIQLLMLMAIPWARPTESRGIRGWEEWSVGLSLEFPLGSSCLSPPVGVGKTRSALQQESSLSCVPIQRVWARRLLSPPVPGLPLPLPRQRLRGGQEPRLRTALCQGPLTVTAALRWHSGSGNDGQSPRSPSLPGDVPLSPE